MSTRRVFRTVLRSGGIAVGVIVGLAATFDGSFTNWADLATISIAVAMVFAGVVTIVVRPFVSAARSGWMWLAGPAAFVLAFALLLTAREIPAGRWRRLPDPPVRVTGFSGPTCVRIGRDYDNMLFASTGSGHPVTFVHRSAEWNSELLEPGSDANAGCHRLDTGIRTPPPPGIVRASYRIDDDGVDCGGRRHYVLLSDGSIWHWSTGSCALSGLVTFPFFCFAFSLVGIATGSALRRQATSEV